MSDPDYIMPREEFDKMPLDKQLKQVDIDVASANKRGHDISPEAITYAKGVIRKRHIRRMGEAIHQITKKACQ